MKRRQHKASSVVDAMSAIGAVIESAAAKSAPNTLAPKAPDRLLPLMELARHWGWSRSKLWRLVKRGEIPHLIIGPRRDVHFRESQVEAWLEAQTIGATPETRAETRRRATERDDEADRLAMCRELGIEPDHQFS